MGPRQNIDERGQIPVEVETRLRVDYRAKFDCEIAVSPIKPSELRSKRSPSRGRSFLLFPSSKMGAIRNEFSPHIADAVFLRSETKNPSQIKQIDFWPVRTVVEVGDFS